MCACVMLEVKYRFFLLEERKDIRERKEERKEGREEGREGGRKACTQRVVRPLPRVVCNVFTREEAKRSEAERS